MPEPKQHRPLALLVDSDPKFAQQVRELWNLEVREGDETVPVALCTLTAPDDVLTMLRQERFQTVFLSTDMLTVGEVDVVSFVREHQPSWTEVFVIYANDSDGLRRASAALANGADGIVPRPVVVDDLQERVRRNVARVQEIQARQVLEDHVNDELLGDAPQMRRVRERIEKVASASCAVLITGETGVGKEFVAKIIHRRSRRANGPFVAINCSAIPENLIESELFGYRKGAFTGAVADKKGLVEKADHGTLFLDEIGDLPPLTQVKLLRFLQDHEFWPLNATESRKVDVRVIAATNRDLQLAMQGPNPTFRSDLFYRLNDFPIHIPPLRERKEALKSLIGFYTRQYSVENEKPVSGFEKEALLALSAYNYPGNIRELQNILKQAVLMSDGGTIRLRDLPDEVRSQATLLALPGATSLADARRALPESIPGSVREVEVVEPEPAAAGDGTGEGNAAAAGAAPADPVVVLAERRPEPAVRAPAEATPIEVEPERGTKPIRPLVELEREAIADALVQLKGNQKEAARRLGISRSTLWRKMQEYGLSAGK
ncbi:MAG: sigma-54-dependent Fis family transcriptional regulator [Fibrobacterales bacterium]|nr:sigma-54-dependent Fis family transcriptional regulator [Fibrobacterales bacterium]